MNDSSSKGGGKNKTISVANNRIVKYMKIAM
jgi:hypothetical protein